MRVLFVCLGNICRSPTAEGVMRDLVVSEGLAEQIELDSAGTGSWHIGSDPDQRATAAAARRGISLEGGARQVEPADLERFDLIIAMDRDNLADLRAMAEHPRHEAKLALLREFDRDALDGRDLDVPDPYYGGDHGFEHVLDVVESACRGLLQRVRSEHV